MAGRFLLSAGSAIAGAVLGALGVSYYLGKETAEKGAPPLFKPDNSDAKQAQNEKRESNPQLESPSS